MGADVAQATGRSAALGISLRRSLLVVGGLQPSSEPALGILDHDFANDAELPRPDELARLLDHRVACIVVGQNKDLSGFRHERLQRLGFLQVEGNRLVTNHIEAAFQKQLGRSEVFVIGRHDDDRPRSASYTDRDSAINSSRPPSKYRAHTARTSSKSKSGLRTNSSMISAFDLYPPA